MRLRSFALLSMLVTCTTGCAALGEETDDSEGAQSGGSVRTIWQDLKSLDGSGWTKLVGEVASDKLQDALSGDRAKLAWDVRAATSGPNVVKSRLPGMTVFDLDTLSSGLLERFGDADLPTRLNEIRRKKVQDGSYYLEAVSSLTLKGGLRWSVRGPDVGFDGPLAMEFGFGPSATLESRAVVHAPEASLREEARAWFNTLVDTDQRDYLFSKSAEKAEKLQPGEMWGLRGEGVIGAHAGIGVPVVVGTPNIVFSLGGSMAARGLVDVQVMKLDNGQVIVDLGIERGSILGWNAGVGTAYGVPTECSDSMDARSKACLPGKVDGIDFADTMPKVAKSLLNRYLGFNVRTGGSKGDSRLSVLRLRFDFANAKGETRDEVRAAFSRAVMFDARHGQTLYYQHMDDPKRPVTVEADLFRAMSSSVRYTNWNAFGMRVYESNDASYTGTTVLKTPTDTLVVSDSIRNLRKGWGNTSHGFDRMAFASISEKGGSQANLAINLATGHRHLDEGGEGKNGQMTANADGTLFSILGAKGPASLDAFGNAMQGRVQFCQDEACALQVIGGGETDPTRALAVFTKTKETETARVPTSGLSPDYARIAAEAARLRLTTQALAGSGDQGPTIDFTYGFRVDDKGLDEMMDESRVAAFKDKVYDYLVATTWVDRGDIGTAIKKEDLKKRFMNGPAGAPAKISGPEWPTYDAFVEKLGAAFVDAAKRYKATKQTEADAKKAMDRFAGRYTPVFVGLDLDSVKNLAANKANSEEAFGALTQARAEAAAKMFDDLYEKARGSGLFSIRVGDLKRTTRLWPEQLVGYTLAQMVANENKETTLHVRVSGDVEGRFAAAGLSEWAGERKPLVAGKVTRITLGALDVQAQAKE